jgi:dTDP-3-amino-3,4,6-trideoxy-alpha-D-glucose transaminase
VALAQSVEVSVPFLDLGRRHDPIAGDLHEAFGRVLGHGGFVLGHEVERFEAAFAEYCGARHCIGVNSGTAAISIAALAGGLGAGDEVIVPAHTFIATACALEAVGLRPRPCDVDDDSGLMDPDAAAAAIGPATAAIMPVHLYGRPANMERLAQLARAHGLLLLEDAAQAHGAEWDGRRAGVLGDAAAFSFYPGKNLGALGDGGAICTDDQALAGRARALRDLGRGERGHVLAGGMNERLDGLQAALLAVKLPGLERENEARREHAAAYRERLAGLELQMPGDDGHALPVHHVFPVRVGGRDAVAERMRARGIDVRVHYPRALHEQPALAGLAPTGSLPVAEAWAREELSLPMFGDLEPEELDAVAAALGEALPA